jgi:3-hydroxymyristoyl/3-hydroxydecanoyl-(acyl carrier protein) dehydratase
LKEIGYRPEPFVVCDALMYADGKAVVEITNMSLRLTGATREEIERLWDLRRAGERPPTSLALFDRDRITAFAIGKPSEAFGDRYLVFDEERVIARLPGPPFQFLDRITEIRNCEPWVMAAGGEIVAEYDVPPGEWYFASNRQPTMPFAVLLEIALQPCGWLAAYLGSALSSPVDLSFRNLGGCATQFEAVGPDAGRLTTHVKITKVSTSGGMIIQNYNYRVTRAGRTVYEGDTYFGFFSKASLAQQVGIRDAKPYQPNAAEVRRGRSFPVPREAPFPDERLRMVDDIDLFIPDSGPLGLGYIRGSKRVNPADWFFQAHFFQDPVWPGSLGLEAFLQLLKIVAAERWGADIHHPGQTMILGQPHTWVYRGQVVQTNGRVRVEAYLTGIDDATRTIRANGFLSVDDRVIYQMTDFTLQG